MEIFNVLAAAAASFFFGALWYMVLSGPWMAASGVAQGADGKPFQLTVIDGGYAVIGCTLIGKVLMAF
ncbi:hypothetical protein N9M77_01415 [Planktomarina temperata]|nr:hypothetical protein [Planktomarina temperata]